MWITNNTEMNILIEYQVGIKENELTSTRYDNGGELVREAALRRRQREVGSLDAVEAIACFY